MGPHKQIEILEAENRKLLSELEKMYLFVDQLLISSNKEKEIVYKELREGMAKYKRLTIGIMKSLTAAIDAKDRYTMGHSSRVSSYTKLLSIELGYSGESLEYLEYAAILHDIGKIGISERILGKREKLTTEEIQVIRRHPITSAKIVQSIDLFQKISLVVLHHHEMFNGMGYPSGLKGDQIPLESRIIAIADSLDAMTSDRPYRKSLGFVNSVEEIKRCSGMQFDPHLVDVFLRMVEEDRFKLDSRTFQEVPG